MTEAAEVHRRVVDLYPEVLAGRLDASLELIHPDVVDHRGGTSGDHVGRDAWRAKYQAMAANTEFHDVSATVERNVSDGEISVNRYTTRGTHTATGKSYAVTGIDMIRVVDGQIIEHWAVRDQTAITHQLGLDQS